MSLEQGFLNPPNSAKPHTWWHWINGNISKAGITADLEAMKKIGLGGAQIFNVEVGIPEGKTPFMSPQWQECMAHAFKEAKRLGIEICVHNCAGWSSSGGPWVKPQDAMQDLTWSETPVQGPGRFDGNLPMPKSKLGYYKDVVVYAIRKPSNDVFRIPNIRQKASFDRGDKIDMGGYAAPGGTAIGKDDVRVIPLGANGHVSWLIPQGDWILIRMGHTPTGAVNAPSPTAGRGPEVDKLSREAMDHFWTGMMASALKDNGAVGKFGLNNALIDSYEVGTQNWSPKFREDFKRLRGYDPMPYLPVVTGRVVQGPEVSERFMWDWRRTVCDLYAENYFGYFKELCHKNGLKFSTEGYGNGSFDNLQVSGMADIPMGEFWVPNGMAQESTKLAASAGHTNGRPVIGAESFTADDNRGRWLVDPYSIKALGDRIFTLGINRYIFHRYAHQPWLNLEPGMTMGPWGMNLERTITWWDQGAAWMKYITRCQYLLQSGRFMADVVVFTGEEGPNDLPLLRGNTVPVGYDYDGCDATVLQKMRVENGQIVIPSGMRYRVLMLPDSTLMTPKTIKKVAELIRAGATVMGPKPTKSPSLADMGAGDQEVQRIANQVWGKVFVGKTVKQVLDQKRILPDVQSSKPVNWIHRFDQGTDLYFVANPAYKSGSIDVTFRTSGRLPELWNPETGTIEPATIWEEKGGRTRVTLRLESAGSVFVVFRKPSMGLRLQSVNWLGASTAPVKPPKIVIISARYEATDGAGGVDVTSKVKSMIESGETEIAATNSNFGDPTYNHVKRLHLVYTIDGKEMTRDLDENQSIELAGAVGEDTPPDYLITNGQIEAWKSGNFEIVGANGKKTIFKGNPKTYPIAGGWDISFPPKKGAPTSIKMPALASWTESDVDGVKYFSGTATYTKSFSAPKDRSGPMWLDLGRVKNFADVELNGHKFETLWKAPFRVEVSKYLKAGGNKLTVKVTNLWPNRLIGDEQYPPEADYRGPIQSWPKWILDGSPRPKTDRISFTTWHFYNKDSALLESGLIGPVQLIHPSVYFLPKRK